MFIKTSPSLNRPVSNCSIVCFCFVVKVTPEGAVCSGSPPSLHWLSFMPGACLSSVAVEPGSRTTCLWSQQSCYFGAFIGGAHFCLFFSWSRRRGVCLCSLNEVLFSAEEMKSWGLVLPDTETLPFTGLSILVWSPWGGRVKEGLHLQEHWRRGMPLTCSGWRSCAESGRLHELLFLLERILNQICPFRLLLKPLYYGMVLLYISNYLGHIDTDLSLLAGSVEDIHLYLK